MAKISIEFSFFSFKNSKNSSKWFFNDIQRKNLFNRQRPYSPYRNQSTNLQNNSIEQFLFEGNIVR